jgi:N-acetylglucosaminyldiphosphoundecaprenol N-acetyl-beta-D-mannosaminyltransferase
MTQGKKKRIRIGGIAIDPLSRSELCERLDALVVSGRPHAVVFCEANLLVQANRSPAVCEAIKQASLVLPDGVAVTLGGYLIGEPFPDRLSGPTVMLLDCAHGVERGFRHFFYGGVPGVPERLAENLSAALPGLVVVGTLSPPFRPLTESEDRDVIARIEKSGCDVLWVGLGAPKQELWMAEHLDRIRVPLMLGVGAAFDFHSGTQRWAPASVRRLGIEWAWRMLLTGGPRIFRRGLDVLPAYARILAREALTRRRTRSERDNEEREC